MGSVLALVAGLVQASSVWIGVHVGPDARSHYAMEAAAIERVRSQDGGEIVFYPVFAGGRGPDGTRAVAMVRYAVSCADGTYVLLGSAQEDRNGFAERQPQSPMPAPLGRGVDAKIAERLVCSDEPLEPLVSGDWETVIDHLFHRNQDQ